MCKKVFILLAVLVVFVSSVGFAGAIPNCDVHNITSSEILVIMDGETGDIYDYPEGNCIVSWKDDTEYGFYNTIIDTQYGPVYEIQLTKVECCNDDFIIGFFNIWRDGVLVLQDSHGGLEMLDQSVGDIFRFWSDVQPWEVYTVINYRFDY